MSGTVAERKYRRFQRGKPIDMNLVVEEPRPKGDLYLLGPLTSVRYLADKNEGREIEFEHEFENELPLLVADELDRLFVVGGSYRITHRGIVG